MKTASQDYKSLAEAAHWYATLNSEQVSEQELAAWRSWLQASPQHQSAWACVEQIDQQCQQIPKGTSNSIRQQPRFSRRQFLSALAALGLSTPVLIAGARWHGSTACQSDYCTTIGEIRQWPLSDGSELWLNTASAVQLEYTPSHRIIRLLQGELLLKSSHEARPMRLFCPHGVVQTEHADFVARLHSDFTQLQVLSGMLHVSPLEQPNKNTLLQAGSSARLSADELQHVASQMHPAAWQRGLLIADGLELQQFIQQLTRYQRGHISCSPAVAALRVVGSYPLHRPADIFQMLQQSLPIRVLQLSPWLIRLVSRH